MGRGVQPQWSHGQRTDRIGVGVSHAYSKPLAVEVSQCTAFQLLGAIFKLRRELIKRIFPLRLSTLFNCSISNLGSSSIQPLYLHSGTTTMPLVWVAETAGIIASASLLIALAVILVIYDDKAVFDWKGVTLNTVVSVLSTASKAALLYTTSELISQWKWIVFTSTRRSLIDFQRIDTASRGPLGSSEIIWRPRAM